MNKAQTSVNNLKLNAIPIAWNKSISPNVYELAFKRFFTFTPGKVVGISINEQIAPRLYSISSSVNDEYIRIIYDVKPSGLLTPKLAKLTKGVAILVSEPLGELEPVEGNAWFIASGTGIAPFLSMLRSGVSQNKTLIHGGRFLDSFYFSDEILDFQLNEYTKCCSQGTSEFTYNGRLTNYIRNKTQLPPDTRFLLCGSPEMVVETRDILIEKGVPFNKIIAEIYF